MTASCSEKLDKDDSGARVEVIPKLLKSDITMSDEVTSSGASTANSIFVTFCLFAQIWFII